MKKMLNILIASDHKAYREVLTRTLNNQPFFHVIAVCADAFAAVTMTGNTSPDIVIIDGSTDPLATLGAIKKIIACSGANVIGTSREADSDFERHLFAAGALGYLSNGSSSNEVICAVNEVAKDNLYSCINAAHIPVPAVPSHVPFIKQSIAKMITKATTSHWHGILQYAN